MPADTSAGLTREHFNWKLQCVNVSKYLGALEICRSENTVMVLMLQPFLFLLSVTQVGACLLTSVFISFSDRKNTFKLVCVQDELMAELEELEQEELDKNLLEIEGTEDVPLPSVPSASLPSRPGITSHFNTSQHTFHIA